MASDSHDPEKPIKGDVESTIRVDGDPGSDDGLIEVRLVGHPCRYLVRIDRSGGAPRLVELQLIHLNKAAGDIDSETLRTVPVLRLAKAAARHIGITELPFDLPAEDSELTARLRPDYKRGRELDDVHYRDFADLLRYARECGLSPREYAKDRFNISIPTVDRWIAEAKERGFLDPNWSNNNGTIIE